MCVSFTTLAQPCHGSVTNDRHIHAHARIIHGTPFHLSLPVCARLCAFAPHTHTRSRALARTQYSLPVCGVTIASPATTIIHDFTGALSPHTQSVITRVEPSFSCACVCVSFPASRSLSHTLSRSRHPKKTKPLHGENTRGCCWYVSRPGANTVRLRSKL